MTGQPHQNAIENTNYKVKMCR